MFVYICGNSEELVRKYTDRLIAVLNEQSSKNSVEAVGNSICVWNTGEIQEFHGFIWDQKMIGERLVTGRNCCV